MSNNFLSPEELVFFSFPALNASGKLENFPLRRVSPDLDDFLNLLPVDSCVVICTSEQSIQNFLAALEEQTRRAGNRLVLDGGAEDWKCWAQARNHVRGESIFTAEGKINPAELDRLGDEAGGNASKVCHVHALQSSQLFTGGPAPVRAGEHKLNMVFFTLVRSPLHPEALGALLTAPAVIIDLDVYLRPGSSSEANRHPEATPPAESVLDGFVEYHRLAQKNVFMEEILSQLETPVLAGYADGRILGGNEAFLNLCGYSRYDLVTRNWTIDLASLDFQALQEKVFASLLATGRTQELHTELQTFKGACVPCNVSVFLHKDEKGRPLFSLRITLRHRVLPIRKVRDQHPVIFFPTAFSWP